MKKWKKITKFVAVIVVFALLLILTISANFKRNQTPTSDIHVEFENEELRFIDKSTILGILENDLDTLKGLRIQEVDLERVEKEIEENEYVENCEAFINNVLNLSFKINQKEPLFRVFHANGVSYYVDNKGIKFPISSTFTANVPIVTGILDYEVDSIGMQRGEAINELVKLFEYAQQEKTVKALITTVNVESNGDLVITPRIKGHKVNIGNAQDLDDKFRRLTIFYKEGLNTLGWDQYSEINLKYKDQVIAKKKEL